MTVLSLQGRSSLGRPMRDDLPAPRMTTPNWLAAAGWDESFMSDGRSRGRFHGQMVSAAFKRLPRGDNDEGIQNVSERIGQGC